MYASQCWIISLDGQDYFFLIIVSKDDRSC